MMVENGKPLSGTKSWLIWDINAQYSFDCKAVYSKTALNLAWLEITFHFPPNVDALKNQTFLQVAYESRYGRIDGRRGGSFLDQSLNRQEATAQLGEVRARRRGEGALCEAPRDGGSHHKHHR